MVMKKLWEDKIKIDDIIELPNGDIGKILKIEKDGVSVLNFDEKRRIINAAYKKRKCNYCNEKKNMMDLFKEQSGRKYRCKICLNKEIRLEEGWVGNVRTSQNVQEDKE